MYCKHHTFVHDHHPVYTGGSSKASYKQGQTTLSHNHTWQQMSCQPANCVSKTVSQSIRQSANQTIPNTLAHTDSMKTIPEPVVHAVRCARWLGWASDPIGSPSHRTASAGGSQRQKQQHRQHRHLSPSINRGCDHRALQGKGKGRSSIGRGICTTLKGELE